MQRWMTIRQYLITWSMIIGCIAYCVAVAIAPWALVWWLLFGQKS